MNRCPGCLARPDQPHYLDCPTAPAEAPRKLAYRPPQLVRYIETKIPAAAGGRNL